MRNPIYVLYSISACMLFLQCFFYVYIYIYMTEHCHFLCRLFTTILYLAFLGLVVVLLIGVFTAQAVSSYSEVQEIADQMANYSSARLLTQTASMLPMWFSSWICMVNSVLIITTQLDSISAWYGRAITDPTTIWCLCSVCHCHSTHIWLLNVSMLIR